MNNERIDVSDSAAHTLPWATPVQNGTFLIDQGTHSWAEVHWLSHRLALVGYKSRDGFVCWERLDVRTGHRRRETAFGNALARRRYERRDGSFSVVAASPDGRSLLGYRDCENFDNCVYEVVGHGGVEQKWPIDNFLNCSDLTWLPDSRSWFSYWKSETSDMLWRFTLGERRPRPCRLRGVPNVSHSAGICRILGSTPDGDAVLSFGQITNTAELKNIVADIYLVPVNDGARARKMRPLRIPFPADRSLLGPYYGSYYQDVELSPCGDRLALTLEQGCDDRGFTTAIYVCDLDGGNFHGIGHIPLHKPTPGIWDGISLSDLCWHPDNRHLSFFYGGFDGDRLYVAAA